MIIRRISICISRGWYREVYGVSFLVLSFLCSCSSSKVVAKENTEGSKGVETLKYKEPADFTKAGVSVISIDTDYININTEYFRELGTETLDILLK
ncbi:MAG: hypothetical protein J6U22_05220 [Bacteroidaceae bacterium]|nr:hypothetical protein [Bacteroidaceae bacterium]